METTSITRLGFCATVVKLRLQPLCIWRASGEVPARPALGLAFLSCYKVGRNTFRRKG